MTGESPANPSLQLLEALGLLQKSLYQTLGPAFQEEGMNITDFRVLWKLNCQGTCRVSELARSVGIAGSTFTGTIDRLEELGLVERLRSAEDRRGVLLKARPGAEDLLRRVKERINNILTGYLAGQPAERLELYAGNLRELAMLFGKETEIAKG